MCSIHIIYFSAGMYCETDGLSEPTGNCAPGWYCSGGAFSDKPQANVSGGFSVDIACPTYLLNETGGMCYAGKVACVMQVRWHVLCR